MIIISHRQALCFPNPDGGDAVRVAPRSVLQVVPNWVRDTPTYQHALKAGLIAEVQPPAPAPAVAAAPAPKMPPTISELLAAGNSREEAAGIVAEETNKWLKGEHPYAPVVSN